MTDRAILLVDDDENLLSGLVRALREQPFKIFTARDGEEAIRFLQTRSIDVIVADQRMPGMSGVQLLTWVAVNCSDVVRIVLTAHAETEMAIRAINDAGVFRFFGKPCNEARLAVAIHQAVERKTALEASRRRGSPAMSIAGIAATGPRGQIPYPHRRRRPATPDRAGLGLLPPPGGAIGRRGGQRFPCLAGRSPQGRRRRSTSGAATSSRRHRA